LRGTIHEDELARLYADHIRFAAGAFHFRERPQLFRPDLQPRLHLGPIQTFMAAQVFLKPGFQRREKFLALFWGQLLFIGLHNIHSWSTASFAASKVSQFARMGKAAALPYQINSW
jgi:hypothetical protein